MFSKLKTMLFDEEDVLATDTRKETAEVLRQYHLSVRQLMLLTAFGALAAKGGAFIASVTSASLPVSEALRNNIAQMLPVLAVLFFTYLRFEWLPLEASFLEHTLLSTSVQGLLSLLVLSLARPSLLVLPAAVFLVWLALFAVRYMNILFREDPANEDEREEQLRHTLHCFAYGAAGIATACPALACIWLRLL